MKQRRVFYSFHYGPDNWRASMVRGIGVIEGNRPATDNDWEQIKKGGDQTIKKWISEQMEGRTCTVVLIGAHTANRKWIDHEIIKSWNKGMGVVGIRIHGLKNSSGTTSVKGENPFDFITFRGSGKKLSSIVQCYDPRGSDSKAKYDWIKRNLATVVEEAIEIRKEN